MPSRTYTGLDLNNYQTFFNDFGGSVTPTPSTPSRGTASLFASGTTLPSSNDSLEAIAQLSLFGDFDYSDFPAIPDGSLISKLDFSYNASCTESATASNTGGGGDRYVTCNGRVEPTLGGTPLTDSLLSGLDQHSGTGSLSSSLSIFDNNTNHTIIEFDPPITKEELQLSYGSIGILLRMPAIDEFSASGGIGAGDTASITGTVAVNNFNLVVTYESGPVMYTLNPSNGNVEIGQQVIVTGPDAANQTYAAVAGGRLIPLEPKVNGPNEVQLTVPYPATDPCFDCFGDCPVCDTCFDACEEDLENDACVECVQACLDCLVQCLEDLQAAEECQQSTGEILGTETPITIVVTGSQFTGTVTLGLFTVLVANGSGIYRFVFGKTNDTVYTTARDGTTYDVKIPDPGATTGFFRS